MKPNLVVAAVSLALFLIGVFITLQEPVVVSSPATLGFPSTASSLPSPAAAAGRLSRRALDTDALYFVNNMAPLLQTATPGNLTLTGDTWPSTTQQQIATQPRPLVWRDNMGNVRLGDDIPDYFFFFPNFINAKVVNQGPEDFNGPAFSPTRPTHRTMWTAIGAGSYSILQSSLHGTLQVSPSTVTGNGGLITFDYLGGRPLVHGDKMFMNAYPGGLHRMRVEVGFIGASDGDLVALSVNTDDSGVANWMAIAMSNSVSTEIDTSVSFGLERLIVGVERTAFDRYNTTDTSPGIDFWVAAPSGALVRRCRIATNVPLSADMTPFMRVRRSSAGSQSWSDDYYVTWLYPIKMSPFP